ncbi:MAG: SAM-dependent methyltransferase, partial [Pseudomonadota bacterium]
LIQIRRALKPDGLFLGFTLGGSTLMELRQAFLKAEADVTGSASARVLPFMDVRDAGALLQRAGFALPVADTDILTARYDTVFDLVRDLRAMGATNVLTGRLRRPLRRAVLDRVVEIYSDAFSDPDGRLRASFEIISLSGWAAHESQQKPLAPGSAQVSLTEVLGSSGDDSR